MGQEGGDDRVEEVEDGLGKRAGEGRGRSALKKGKEEVEKFKRTVAASETRIFQVARTSLAATLTVEAARASFALR